MHNKHCLNEFAKYGVYSSIPESQIHDATDSEVDAALAEIHQRRLDENENDPTILKILECLDSFSAPIDTKEFLTKWLGILREGFVNGKARYKGNSDLISLVMHAPGASLEIALYQQGLKEEQEAKDYLESEVRKLRGKIAEFPAEWLSDLNIKLADLKHVQGVTKNVKFAIDLALCVEYLRGHNKFPVCDSSASSLTKCSYPSSHLECLEIFKSITFAGMDALAEIAREDQRVVWISWGASLGLPIREKKCKISQSLTDGRLFGVVGASAFNGGYAGLTLYEWDGEGWLKNQLGRVVAKFYCGEVIENFDEPVRVVELPQ